LLKINSKSESQERRVIVFFIALVVFVVQTRLKQSKFETILIVIQMKHKKNVENTNFP